jgi:hypothetical protein
MAWITPPVFVALQTLTDSVMNQLSSRLSDLFPYTTIGDMPYASATDTLSRLGIGTAGGATAPEWVDSLVFNGVYAYRGSAQTIGNSGAHTIVPFTATLFDTNSYWSAGSPNVLTIPATGYYIVSSHLTYAPNATGGRELKVYREGVKMDALSDGVAAIATVSNVLGKTAIVSLTAADELSLYTWQNSGGNLDTEADKSTLIVAKIGV